MRIAGNGRLVDRDRNGDDESSYQHDLSFGSRAKSVKKKTLSWGRTRGNAGHGEGSWWCRPYMHRGEQEASCGQNGSPYKRITVKDKQPLFDKRYR